jgi:ATP-dependent 26S proteasome regulatory subunit
MPGMQGLHSATKGEREVIRQLVHSVLIRDMGTFNPERFKEWIKAMDRNFRKVALTLTFRIQDRIVNFAIKEVRSRRTIFQFSASTHVRFDDREVVMEVAAVQGNHL